MRLICATIDAAVAKPHKFRSREPRETLDAVVLHCVSASISNLLVQFFNVFDLANGWFLVCFFVQLSCLEVPEF